MRRARSRIRASREKKKNPSIKSTYRMFTTFLVGAASLCVVAGVVAVVAWTAWGNDPYCSEKHRTSPPASPTSEERRPLLKRSMVRRGTHSPTTSEPCVVEVNNEVREDTVNETIRPPQQSIDDGLQETVDDLQGTATDDLTVHDPDPESDSDAVDDPWEIV